MPGSREARADPAAPVDIAIVEDVWGRGFEPLRSRFSIAHAPGAWDDPDALATLVGRARALVVRNRTAVTRSLLEGAPRLEVVARAGTGTDNIDLVAADELGIVVVVATGANARSVAEHCLCLALALARDLQGHARRIRQGLWERPLGVQLAGRTWGVVGLGTTGSAVGRLARSVGMEVLGHDPYLPEDAEPVPGSQRVDDLLELAARADVVSLHIPLTSESAGLIGREFFEHMRPGSYLVNVARGRVVDEQALADALDAGRLAGAALDVRPQEPPGPSRWDVDERVILTPHVAGLTHEAQEAVVSLLADDLIEVLSGSPASRAVGRWRRSRVARSRPRRSSS
ncbi:MAG TPA: hydroxyacid dehydrogenase [Acidimicrobiales bacterium]|nr:hydroxyacid dehydrogenase [Acidimicrobiales bacterium]